VRGEGKVKREKKKRDWLPTAPLRQEQSSQASSIFAGPGIVPPETDPFQLHIRSSNIRSTDDGRQIKEREEKKTLGCKISRVEEHVLSTM